eukprot:scaffold155588_cov18-Tisochrysis_lutea.AAC.2
MLACTASSIRLHVTSPCSWFTTFVGVFHRDCAANNGKQIANPEVPHSLRLQGILVGGVVVVYNKQSVYLLEDVQDMVVSEAGCACVR